MGKSRSMAPCRVMRFLVVASICLWVCVVAIGENSAIISDEVEAARMDSRTRHFDAISAEPEVDPTDNPGRRRRTDARRRTHQPKRTPQQIDADKLAGALKVAENYKKAAQAARVKKLTKKRVTAKAKARLEKSARKKKRQFVKEVKVSIRAQSLYVKSEAQTTELGKVKEKDKEVILKTGVLKSAVVEAMRNVADAMEFCKAVKNGQGDAAFRRSYLSKEQKAQGVGGIGGLANLKGIQFNIPWLVDLNKKLSSAKIDTTYQNLIAAQKSLDTASEHESALERKWKTEERHRQNVNEALMKDAVTREAKMKQSHKKELIEKRSKELQNKKENKQKRLVALKTKTDNLMKESKEVETKMIISAAGGVAPPAPAPAPAPPAAGAAPAPAPGKKTPAAAPAAGERTQLKEDQGDRARTAAKLMKDAEHSQMMAKHFKAKELTSKKRVHESQLQVQELMKESNKHSAGDNHR